MRITFDESYINKLEQPMPAEKKTAGMKKLSKQAAYQVDFSKKKTNAFTYTQQGMTAEELKQNVSTQNVQTTKNYMAVMSGCMSDQDFAKLQEQGYKPGNMEIDVAVTVVDEIKAKLMEAGEYVPGYTDTLDSKTLEAIAGKELAASIQNAAESAGVVLTESNVAEIKDAVTMAESLNALSDETIHYMVTSGKDAEIEKLYFAQHSSINTAKEQGIGIDPIQMKAQIEEIIDRTGLVHDEKNFEIAEEIVRSGIPLTEETLQNMIALKSLQLPMSIDDICTAVMNAVADGKNAKEADLTKKDSSWQQAVSIYESLQAVTNEAADLVAEENFTFSVARMKEAQDAIDAGERKPTRENLHARRVLEETRLQMTIHANHELLKSGYAIETAEMEELIDALKEAEEAISHTMFRGKQADEAKGRAEIFKEVLEITHFIPKMPLSNVQTLLDSTDGLTLPDVKLTGEKRMQEYRAANERYETFMTTPRADLGDSIKEAFRNAEALLHDLDLESNEENLRAVRILGYNRMEISEDNIASVNEADSMLRKTVEKLTPAATLQLIRSGKNPLHMTVEALYNELSGQQEYEDNEPQRYSKYLYQLEHKKEITTEEKESYIGIYRLLRQIEKSDDAVIGTLLNEQAEVTFENLLGALRTRKVKNLDVRVNDAFGGLKDVRKEGVSIDQQIQAAYDAQRIQAATEEYVALKEYGEFEKEEAKLYREACEDGEELAEVLEKADLPVTAENLLAAKEYVKQEEKLFNRLQKINGRETFSQKLLTLEEHFESEEEALEAYREFEKTESERLDNAIAEDRTLTSLDVRQMAFSYKQLSIMAKKAENREYDIPIFSGDSCIALHLTVESSDIKKGRVEGHMETKEAGTFSFKLIVDEEGVSGLLIGSKEEGEELLHTIGKNLEEKLGQQSLVVKEMQTGVNKELTINKTDTTSKDAGSISTAKLYKVAKALITTIRETAERN